MAQFESGGIAIAYDDVGPKDAGRPVILIHGFASNRNENWRRVGWYGALERRRLRFIALDCRGHGESGKPHDCLLYTSDAADDLLCVDLGGRRIIKKKKKKKKKK